MKQSSMRLKMWCLQKNHWGTLVLNVPPVQREQPSDILAQKNQDQSGISPFSSSFIQYLWPRPYWTPMPTFSCPVFFHQVHFRLSLIPSCITRGRRLSFAPGSPEVCRVLQLLLSRRDPQDSASWDKLELWQPFWHVLQPFPEEVLQYITLLQLESTDVSELRSHERPEYFPLSEKERAPSSRRQAVIDFTNMRLLVSPALLQPLWLPC